MNAAEAHRAVKLKGLDEEFSYELWNRETNEKVIVPAAILLREGFPVDMKPESAVIFTYKKA